MSLSQSLDTRVIVEYDTIPMQVTGNKVFLPVAIKASTLDSVRPITRTMDPLKLSMGPEEAMGVWRNGLGNVQIHYTDPVPECNFDLCLSPCEAKWLRQALEKAGY